MEQAYRWYVDPLDGTTNFAHGFPAFCISMGLEYRKPGLAANEDGEIVAGIILDPLRDEMFVAEKEMGAYLNGRPIHVSKTKSLGEALLATGFPSHKRHANPNIHFYHQITLRSHGLRRAGSAALDLAYTACGRIDAYWEFNLNPWDTAAGVLPLVREWRSGTVTRTSTKARSRWTAARSSRRTACCWMRSRAYLYGDVRRARAGADPHACGVQGHAGSGSKAWNRHKWRVVKSERLLCVEKSCSGAAACAAKIESRSKSNTLCCCTDVEKTFKKFRES